MQRLRILARWLLRPLSVLFAIFIAAQTFSSGVTPGLPECCATGSGASEQQKPPKPIEPVKPEPQKSEAPAAQPTKDTPATEPADVAAWRVLTEALAGDDGIKRADAVAALATIGPRRDIVSVVEARMADTHADVRQAAATSLGVMKARQATQRLRAALEDESPDVSFAAARTLWEMGNRSGRDLLVDVLAGQRHPKKAGEPSRLTSTKQKLRNPSELGKLGLKEGAGMLLGPFSLGIGVVEELAKDRAAPARALAAIMLATDTDPESVRDLEEALVDNSSRVRAAAARALGVRGQRESVPRLAPLLEDEKHVVRYMAAAAIVRLTGRAAPAMPSAPPPSKKP